MVIGDIVLAEDLARMVLIFWEEHENTLDQQLSLALLYFNGFFFTLPRCRGRTGIKDYGVGCTKTMCVTQMFASRNKQTTTLVSTVLFSHA